MTLSKKNSYSFPPFAKILLSLSWPAPPSLTNALADNVICERPLRNTQRPSHLQLLSREADGALGVWPGEEAHREHSHVQLGGRAHEEAA